MQTLLQRMNFLQNPRGLAAALSAAALLSGCSDGASTAGSGTDKAYTLDTCVVSGEKLGSMGDPVVKVYDGQQVKFCCNACVKDFEKDKAKFLAKIAEGKK